MKREYVEKIQKAAKEHFPNDVNIPMRVGFVEGAEWMAETFLQKAKKFLLENRDDLSRMTTPDFVKKFEQEMLS